MSEITVSDALRVADQLKAPTRIKVQEDDKYWSIVQYRFYENESLHI